VLALGALVGLPATAGAALPTSAVVQQSLLPPGTYGQLGARWWQWALQTPMHGPRGQISQFAALGPTSQAVDCSYGQSGQVWFLASAFGTQQTTVPTGVAVRSCTIPVGRAVFVPVYNTLQDNLPYAEEDPPDPLYTEPQLRHFADEALALGSHLAASVDGVPVSALNGSTRYRARSPLFHYRLSADNLYTFVYGDHFPTGERNPEPGGAADGWYLLVVLAPGRHVLHWTATSFYPGVDLPKLDITYTITVR
jgi:hypothetical protein